MHHELPSLQNSSSHRIDVDDPDDPEAETVTHCGAGVTMSVFEVEVVEVCGVVVVASEKNDVEPDEEEDKEEEEEEEEESSLPHSVDV